MIDREQLSYLISRDEVERYEMLEERDGEDGLKGNRTLRQIATTLNAQKGAKESERWQSGR